MRDRCAVLAHQRERRRLDQLEAGRQRNRERVAGVDLTGNVPVRLEAQLVVGVQRGARVDGHAPEQHLRIGDVYRSLGRVRRGRHRESGPRSHDGSDE